MTDLISSITPYLIPGGNKGQTWWNQKPYVLIKVKTKHGVTGWGECHLLTFREKPLISMIRSVAERLLGKPAGNIRDLLQMSFNSFGEQRPSLEVYSAFAGIEIALWDILGKTLNVPVYQLLGGSCHESLPVYANIYSPNLQPPEAYAEMALKQVSAGHNLIKLYPFLGKIEIKDGLKILEAVRAEVGDDIGLAVDLWRQVDPSRAISIAKAIEPFNVLWIEDPFPPTDPDALRYVRESIVQPLMTGETLPTRREFSPLITKQAIDLVNPDVCLSGILEIQAIASLAETSFVKLSPHNSNSMALGMAISANVSAGIPNLGIIEYFPLFEKTLDNYCTGRPVVESGKIPLPMNPGLGIEFDQTAMTKFKIIF